MSTATTDARLDALQAAVVALAATLPRDSAAAALAVLGAAAADLEDNHTPAADAAAAGVFAAVLGALARPGC